MQKIPFKKERPQQQPNNNILLSKDQGIRNPKPPSIPRSQSSKDLQQARKNSSHFRTGRRLLYRSYSTPNVSYCEDLKLPKTTRNLLEKGQRNYAVDKQKVENVFKGQNFTTEHSGTVYNMVNSKRPQTVVGSLTKSSFKTLGNECRKQTYNSSNCKACSLCKSLLCNNCIPKEQYCVYCKGHTCNSLKLQTVDDFRSQTYRVETKGSQTSKGLQDLSYDKVNKVLNGFQSSSVFERSAEVGQELPCVYSKPEPESDALHCVCCPLTKPTEKHAKSREWLNEPVIFDTDDIVDLQQDSVSSNSFEAAQPKKHAVFFIDHDDGRLQPSSNLLPVPEETGQEQHPKSPWHCYRYKVSTNRYLKLANGDSQSNMELMPPWQCHSNESKIVLNGLRKSANQAAGSQMTSTLTWQCYDDNRKFNVVDELFDSDTERLVIKPHLKDSGLDADKKAMIDSWIRDVTLNTSMPNA